MPLGRVKTFDPTRGFGFIVAHDDGRDVYVHKDEIASGDGLHSGDVVEFDLVETTEPGASPQARSVKVVRPAPPGNPVGRVMHAPPTWEELEERERLARQARRRRR